MRREARNPEEVRRLNLLPVGAEKRRKIIGVITLVLVTVAGTAAAQDVSAAVDGLLRTGLEPGDEVYVTDFRGERKDGRVSEVSSAGLTIKNGNDEWSWAATDIVRVEARDSLTNGIWIGVAIGVGTFLMRCHYGGNRTGICPIIPYAVTAGYVDLGLGVYLGALFDRHMTRTLYRVPPPARVEVSPLVSHERMGMRLAVTW